MSNDVLKRSRELTDKHLEPLEKKIRAGAWYPVDKVHSVMLRVITEYETMIQRIVDQHLAKKTEENTEQEVEPTTTLLHEIGTSDDVDWQKKNEEEE